MDILKYPNEFLRTIAVDITILEILSEEVIQFVEDMKTTMANNNGAGLSSIQVGDNRNIFVYRANDGNIKSMYNVKILGRSGKQKSFGEGCLSLENVKKDIRRSKIVIIKAYNLEGEKVRLKVSGKEAVIVQHEIDHLKGKLLIDY